MKEKKTWYEPHPVSPERKAELRKQGYAIMDDKFKPAGVKQVASEPKEEDPKQVRNVRGPGRPSGSASQEDKG